MFSPFMKNLDNSATEFPFVDNHELVFLRNRPISPHLLVRLLSQCLEGVSLSQASIGELVYSISFSPKWANLNSLRSLPHPLP